MEIISRKQPISALTNSTARMNIVVNVVPGCGCTK